MVGRRVLVLAAVVLVVIASGVALGTNVVSVDGDTRPTLVELVSDTDPLVADTDGDGLGDGREVRLGTDPVVVDTDGDSVADGPEVRRFGTSPTLADTDRDGLDDGNETAWITNATDADTDADGLDDGPETDRGTDPTTPDTDDDDLTDGREVDLDTDPLVVDTDGDGLADGREVDAVGTDPLTTDTDGDGLADEPEVTTLRTNATLADTDADGLDDGRELDGPTNATLADTDADGLDDGREYDLGGDPLVRDTDGDTLLDGREANVGTNLTTNDTDGDTLLDPWELQNETDEGVALPGADPLRMDLYVQTNPTRGADGLDDYAWVREQFAEMPVDNPDNTTGITLHVVPGERIGERVVYNGSNFFPIVRSYNDVVVGERYDVYHSVVFATFEDTFLGGISAPGGTNALVADDPVGSPKRELIVHELLHTVVGRIHVDGRCPDDRFHYCAGGWLESGFGRTQELPEPLARQLERDGFAD